MGFQKGIPFSLEVQAGFEPADNGVADRGLTTWLLYQIFDCFNIIAELLQFVKGFLKENCFFIKNYCIFSCKNSLVVLK